MVLLVCGLWVFSVRCYLKSMVYRTNPSMPRFPSKKYSVTLTLVSFGLNTSIRGLVVFVLLRLVVVGGSVVGDSVDSVVEVVVSSDMTYSTLLPNSNSSTSAPRHGPYLLKHLFSNQMQIFAIT